MAAESPDEIAELRRTHYNATVVWLRKPHPDLMVMRVRPDFPRPVHRAGQYTSLGLGYWEPRYPGCQEEVGPPPSQVKVIRRAYSISCSILDDQGKLLDLQATHWLEFYIVLVRESDQPVPPGLTPRLFMLEEGHRLYVGEKITGRYTLAPVQPGDTVVFLATGTGEAPHNYMLWELLHRGHTGRILSACCVRYRRDLAYLPVHDELMRRYPHYTYLSLTTREADMIGQKVYIQDLIQSGQLEERLHVSLDPARTHVYLCGNPKMIGMPLRDRDTGQHRYPQPVGVIEILESRGFRVDEHRNVGNIHCEEYW
jgi:ferredoxin--NADP+ reductase